MRPLTLADPFGSGELCSTCLVIYPSHVEAVHCARSHPPVIPGGPMRHRPDYVPTGARYIPGPRTYRPRPITTRPMFWLAVVLVAVCFVLAAIVLTPWRPVPACAGEPGCAWVVPTTYGPPGPSGGPR